MRNIILISTFFLFLGYKKAHALTPEECLQSIIKDNKNDRNFAGSDNIYCAYSSNGSIVDATFNIKNSELNDWDIKVGTWDSKSSFTEKMTPTVVKENETYKIKFEKTNNNAIIWTMNGNSSGEIENINIEENILQKRDNNNPKYNTYKAFSEEGEMIWEDISWDTKVEKSINLSLGEINMNNTVFLNAISLLFMKKIEYKKQDDNNKIADNYVESTFTLKFKMKTDNNRWKVYGGYYDILTKKVEIYYTWNLTPSSGDNVKVDNESSKNEDTNKLPHNLEDNKHLLTNHYYNIVLDPDTSEEKRAPYYVNVFWIVNDAFEGGSQRIWIKDIMIKEKIIEN